MFKCWKTFLNRIFEQVLLIYQVLLKRKIILDTLTETRIKWYKQMEVVNYLFVWLNSSLILGIE